AIQPAVAEATPKSPRIQRPEQSVAHRAVLELFGHVPFAERNRLRLRSGKNVVAVLEPELGGGRAKAFEAFRIGQVELERPVREELGVGLLQFLLERLDARIECADPSVERIV